MFGLFSEPKAESVELAAAGETKDESRAREADAAREALAEDEAALKAERKRTRDVRDERKKIENLFRKAKDREELEAAVLPPLELPVASGRVPLGAGSSAISQACLVWEFCQTFKDMLSLAPCTLDDFCNALESPRDSVLLVETGLRLMRLLLQDGSTLLEDDSIFAEADALTKPPVEEPLEEDDGRKRKEAVPPKKRKAVEKAPPAKKKKLTALDLLNPATWERCLARCLVAVAGAVSRKCWTDVDAVKMGLEARDALVGGKRFSSLETGVKVGALAAVVLRLYSTKEAQSFLDAAKERQEELARLKREGFKESEKKRKNSHAVLRDEATEILKAEKAIRRKRKKEEGASKEPSFAEVARKVDSMRNAATLADRKVVAKARALRAVSDDEDEAIPYVKDDSDDDEDDEDSPEKPPPASPEAAAKLDARQASRAAHVLVRNAGRARRRLFRKGLKAQRIAASEALETATKDVLDYVSFLKKQTTLIPAATSTNAADLKDALDDSLKGALRAKLYNPGAGQGSTKKSKGKAPLDAKADAADERKNGFEDDDGDAKALWCTQPVADALCAAAALRRLAEDDDEANRHDALLDAETVRRESLGTDRDANIYWTVDDHLGRARVLVQSLAKLAAVEEESDDYLPDDAGPLLPEAAEWRCYSSRTEFSKLYDALSDAHGDEKLLRQAIRPWRADLDAENGKHCEWRTDDDAVGRLVLRRLGRNLASGTVAGFVAAEDNEGVALWHVEYSDGDEEDLEDFELLPALNAAKGAFRNYANAFMTKRTANFDLIHGAAPTQQALHALAQNGYSAEMLVQLFAE
mmetsp:Transcript_15302/g.51456  ORF Transcript_15302/g.51456 Transcript_15302/m.51456 type:complete len:814 (+) Transcript_15302:79-2520(+)